MSGAIHDPAGYELAEINIAKLLAPIDDPRIEGFVDGLDQINVLAESSPGFCWRLQDADGASATSIRAFDDELVLINMSSWESVDYLKDFVFNTVHREFLRRRREWFGALGELYAAMWWVPAGHRPDEIEGIARLEMLRESGPTPEAFTFKERFAPPSGGAS